METVHSDKIETQARYAAIAGWLGLAIAYTVVFRAFGENSVFSAAQRALINVIPAALLTLPVLHIVETYIIDRSALVQAAAHLCLAIIFSLLWYAGLQAGYGLRDGWLTEGLSGRPLLGVALTWQLFQGITLYAVAALYCYARIYRRRLAEAELLLSSHAKEVLNAPSKRAQIFVKDGKSMKPVAIAEIFALSGAGDYSEVFTKSGNYLASTTLAEFEDLLPRDHFARVHRSHIIRLDAVLEIEPAGNGRLSVHLPSGVSVVTSRAGAKFLREQAV